MTVALRDVVVPALRQRGFVGTFPHFGRFTSSRIDVVTFQFDRSGGGFVVEVASTRSGEFTTTWGERIPVERLTVAYLPANARLRVGSAGRSDHWFRYDDGTEPTALARSVLDHLPEADRWWASSESRGS